MNHEREQSHGQSPTDSSPDRDDVEPGRATRSALMRKPDQALASGLVHRKARDDNGVAEGADQAVSAASSSSGSALPETLMRKFETSLGADLSGVRVHTGGASATAAHAVGAKAYTMGNDIHFGEGHFDPSSPSGEHLLAHEVAHTVQQSGGAQRMQFKLEVSSAGDHLEHEADRAADAMVAGSPASVGGGNSAVQRDLLDDVKGGAKIQGLPEFNDKAPAPGLLKIGPDQPPIDLMNGTTVDTTGVPYTVPASDYRSHIECVAMPSFDKEMPKASIPDPGAIPGWHTIVPEQKTGTPPLVITTPATPYVVRGTHHSNAIKDAWEQYKTALLPKVSAAWNDDARAKLNTFIQQKNEVPEIKQLFDDSKKYYDMPAPKVGAGTVSAQGLNQQVMPGSSISTVAGQVDAGGKDLLAGAASSVAQPDNTTVPTDVKDKVNALNRARAKTRGFSSQFDGVRDQLVGAKIKFGQANDELAALKAKEEKGDETDAMKSAKAIANQIHPELGRMVTAVLKYEPLYKKLSDVVKTGAKALEGDPTAIYETVVKTAEAASWFEAKVAADRVQEVVGENPLLTNTKAAAAAVSGLAKAASGLSILVEESVKDEKAAYELLAKTLETAGNWKGAKSADGKTAANAMRALPVVDRMIRELEIMRDGFPGVPGSTTRQSQGYTLATQGDPAPGAAALERTAGWIEGAPKTVDAQLPKWREIRKQLGSVSTALGIV